MDRRRVTTWLGSAALLSAFSVPAHAAQKGTLTIWINQDKGYNGLQKVADEYARASGMRVKVEHFDNAVGNFEDAMKAGKGPDIWIWPHDRLGEWIKQGWLSPVQPSDALRNCLGTA